LAAAWGRAFSGEVEQTFQIVGPAGATPQIWTASRLEKEFAAEVKPVEYVARGHKHTYNCVPLMSVLKAAGAPTEIETAQKPEPKLKSYPLRFIAVVQGRDGYVVAFSLAELLPSIGNRQVWLALEMDGAPLLERESPARLIVPEDKQAARGVHQIAAITIINAAEMVKPAVSGASTQPSATSP
jgi:hypothetical protein